MFLENETWELCPVKSNFNIAQLHVSKRHSTEAKRWREGDFIYSTVSLTAVKFAWGCETLNLLSDVCARATGCKCVKFTAHYKTQMKIKRLLSLMGCMLDSFSHTHEPQLKNTTFPMDCTSISESPIPPHPIGLKSGGRLCTVNSMSHSGNQFEMIWDGKLTCWKQPSDDGYAVHKGMEMVSRNTQVTLWHLTMLKKFQD